ncbi:hypothetical protein H632_c797p1, partial [Helicosporidium sp. ATCC 50920]
HWPGVSVVVPLRGLRARTLSNLRRLVQTPYPGPLEFLFVLDSASDPAAAPLRALLAAEGLGGESKGVQKRSDSAFERSRSARLVTAVRATSSSQKIRNLLCGAAARRRSSAFVLCLDDDVALPPPTLRRLVADLTRDSSLFMATGYPFDTLPADAGLAAHAARSYHLPLVVAFSIQPRISFVWGGCMLFRAAALDLGAGEGARGDGGCAAEGPAESSRVASPPWERGCVARTWLQGGYSDDLGAAACCARRGLDVYCPPYAVFPQWLDARMDWARFWNYLSRQLFVLDTYSTPEHRRTNRVMMAAHCYLSWGLVGALLAALGRVGLAAACGAHAWLNTTGFFAAWLGTRGSSATCLARVAAPVFWAPPLLLAAACLAAAAALHSMTRALHALFEAQDPELPRKGREALALPCQLRQWAGFLLCNALVPLCLAWTLCSPRIQWAGVTYERRRGLIVRVEHGDAVVEESFDEVIVEERVDEMVTEERINEVVKEERVHEAATSHVLGGLGAAGEAADDPSAPPSPGAGLFKSLDVPLHSRKPFFGDSVAHFRLGAVAAKPID